MTTRTPRFLVARAVVEADRERDAVVAERYGVKPQTIRTWRRRAAKDVELRALVDQARRRSLEEWRPESAATLIALLADMRRRAREGEEIPYSLIGAVKTVGALNVEAGALLGHGEPEVEQPWGEEADAEREGARH